MSRTDKKPTYMGKAKTTLAVWCKADDDPDVLGGIFGMSQFHAGFAAASATAALYANIDPADFIPGVDKTAVFAAQVSANKPDTGRTAIAREAVATWFTNSTSVFEGARAVYKIAHLLLDPSIYELNYVEANQATKAAIDLNALVQEDAFVPHEYIREVGKVLHSDTILTSHMCAITAIQKLTSSSVSQEVFRAWACIQNVFRMDDAYVAVSELPPDERFAIDRGVISKIGYRTYYAAGVLVMVGGNETLLLDSLARDKLRRVLTSCWTAWIYARMNAHMGYDTVSATIVKRVCYLILKDACDIVSKGDSASDIAKGLNKYHMALLQGMAEENPDSAARSREMSAMLMAEADTIWPNLGKFRSIVHGMEDYARMEVSKLSNIIVSDDADPAICVKRLKEQQEAKRTVKGDTWRDFMNFVKAYDFARETCHSRAVPSYSGTPPDGEWLIRCMDGVFTMPPRKVWGKFWISSHYDDKDTTPYEWLDAQDVTWVGPNMGGKPEIANELVQAWFNGPRIDGFRNGPDAANWSLEKGVFMYWASKAEGAKAPEGMRLTASADSGARALFSSYESAERNNSDVIPGFGQNLNAFEMCDKMNSIYNRCVRAPNGVVSSHDVKGWSEFEDRTAKNEYLEYEAGKFADPMIAKSDKLWANVVSVFDRLGHEYSGPFLHGGVQGLNGASDTLLHAKIIAYIHQTGIEKGILSGSANTLTCIDDVLYNPATKIRGYKARSEAVRNHIEEIYKDMAYPLDPLKSIMGMVKYIFLSDAYSDGGLIASPLRVALKMDTDEQCAIRDVITDVSAYMSTASAIAVAQGPPRVAYLMGTLLLMNRMYGLMSKYMPDHVEHTSVWALAPIGEGGLGIPTYRQFIAGSDPDVSFTWRDAIRRSEYAKPGHDSALAAMASHALSPVSAASSFRDPMAVVHEGPASGLEVKKHLINQHMVNAPHAKEWDDIRKRGESTIEKLAQSIAESGGVVDALICGDIAQCFPDSLYEGVVTRFANGNAISHLVKRRTVWKIARACARADRKWMKHAREVAAIAGYEPIDSPYDRLLEARRIVHPSMSIVNHVVPSPRAQVAFAGKGDMDETMTSDYVTVDPGKIKVPGKRWRADQRCVRGDRSIGMISSSASLTEFGRKMKRDPVSTKIVKMSIILKTLKGMGVNTDFMATAFENSWGLNYPVDTLKVVDMVTTAKRVGSITGKTHNLALAYRHVYAASTARTNTLMDFCETNVEHSIANPLNIAHNLRMCALSASADVGLATKTFGPIMWKWAPAADVPWEYVVHPAAFVSDNEDEFAEHVFPVREYEIPDAEHIDHIAQLCDLKSPYSGESTVHTPAISAVGIYRVKLEHADVGGGRPRRTLVAVRRPVPKTKHGTNLLITSVIRTRISEHISKEKISIEDIIWGTEANPPNIPIEVLDKIWSDTAVVTDVGHGSITKCINYLTKTKNYTSATKSQVADTLKANASDRVQLIRAAYDGMVGNRASAYSGEQRALVVMKSPEPHNVKTRAKTLNGRGKILQARYAKEVAKSSDAKWASRWQGRMFARSVWRYSEGVTRSISKESAMAFYVRTSSVPADAITEACGGEWVESPTIGYLLSVNRIVADWKPDLGWNHAEFLQGYYFEMDYMDKDEADMANRIFAVSPSHISNTDEARSSTYTVTNVQTEEEEFVPTGSAAAVIAAAMAAAASKETSEGLQGVTLDTLWGLEDSDEDDDDYEGIV